jgi:hypothetical protein
MVHSGVMEKDRVTVDVGEITLSNSLQLTALVELLEEKGILSQEDVIKRMEEIRDRNEPS